MRCGLLLAMALLTGCTSAGQSPPSLGSAIPEHVALAGAVSGAQPDRTVSWIAPGAKPGYLLYISDVERFAVYIYSFPSLKHTGTLTGFNEPQGECSDASGDVWIANTGTSQLFEYAPGAKSPTQTLADPLGYPTGCAIDAASGDLAVANITGFSGNGSVLIYRKAAGTPTPYSNSAIVDYYFDGYDSKGDLYVSGLGSANTYELGVLAHGSSSMALVTLQGATIHFPGTVAWVGSSLVLGDQRCDGKAGSCLYEASVSGKTAHVTHQTLFAGACDVAQAWVGATRVAAGDYDDCARQQSGADLWPYPAGGNPTAKTIDLQMPVGAALGASP
jgi:hypothetical protein